MSTVLPRRRRTVYILRASPFHNGHAELLKRAITLSDEVIVVLGSAYQPRTVKNPFTAREREGMICDYISELHSHMSIKCDIRFVYARDFRYSNTRWLSAMLADIGSFDGDTYITGSDRDPSTFYLKMFPDWKLDLVEENRTVSKELSATRVREIYFGKTLNGVPLDDGAVAMLLKAFVPPTTLDFLLTFKETNDYKKLVSEYEFYKWYANQFPGNKYPPNHVTTDAVVFQSGKVLLIKRRNNPGKDLWALPGGHVNQNEWMFDGVIRELREETKLDIPTPALIGSLIGDRMFDDPNRSLRFGRTYTRAYAFLLPDILVNGEYKFHKVKGSDDAKMAKWFPIHEALEMSEYMFEDHCEILEIMHKQFLAEKDHYTTSY